MPPTPALMLVLGALLAGQGAGSPGENIARGRPYTLSPPPNYSHCTDEGDLTQLTDGVVTQNYFWTQPGTVGWSGARQVEIILDLGEPQPISGVSYRTAAGVADVGWPRALELFVSDDGQQWWRASELVGLSAVDGLPPGTGYTIYRFRTDRLRCHGRYLALVAMPGGGYLFCDEIEVYRGPEEFLDLPREGPPVTDLKQAVADRAVTATARNRMLADAAAVQAEVEASGLPVEERADTQPWSALHLLGELAEARAAVGQWEAPPGFLALLPHGPAHERIFAVRAAVWSARGLGLSVWQSGRYDPLQPGDTPPKGAPPPAIELVMLGNEVRGATLNVTNPTPQQQTVSVRFEDLPGGAQPDWLTVHEVAWTGTSAGPPVACALPEAKRTNDGWEVAVPSGMTRQVWFSVDSRTLEPGDYGGHVLLIAGDKPLATVPFSLHVAAVRMPDRLALSLGGWDYTDGPTYGVTERNLEAVVAFLQRYHVDAPWASAAVMPFGTHDETGRLVEPPDTQRMDDWLARWPQARFYFVFNAFNGELLDTPADRRRIGEWITFWVNHLVERGIRPSQLGLLLIDEPGTPETDRAIVSYAQAIRAAQPQVTIFEDPVHPDPRQASPELYENCTVLCPNRPMWMGNRPLYEEVFLAQQQAGRQLAFYSCSGPVRSLDPYSYHRLQAWDCFRYGMVHMGYWAFGDNGGASSWNEYATSRFGFCPQFLGPEGCVTSKHMEAIREGLFDHQTLTLLAEKVAAQEKAGRDDEVLRRARRLLVEGPQVVTQAPGAENIRWAADKDRSLADRVRREAIELLEGL